MTLLNDIWNRIDFDLTKLILKAFGSIWGYSSAGRALEWHSTKDSFSAFYSELQVAECAHE